MGTNEIIGRTVNGEANQRMVIHDNFIARSMYIGTDWERIRIGLRLVLNSQVSLTANFAVGVCSGMNRPYGKTSVNPVHFVGIQDTETTWTYAAGPPPSFGNLNFSPYKDVEGTPTVGTLINSNVRIVADPGALRSVLMIDIIKGSPNFTLDMGFPFNLTAIGLDVTDSIFSLMMETPIADLDQIQSGYTFGVPRTIAVDEAADGYLDTANLYWDQSAGMEIVDFNVYRRVFG